VDVAVCASAAVVPCTVIDKTFVVGLLTETWERSFSTDTLRLALCTAAATTGSLSTISIWVDVSWMVAGSTTSAVLATVGGSSTEYTAPPRSPAAAKIVTISLCRHAIRKELRKSKGCSIIPPPFESPMPARLGQQGRPILRLAMPSTIYRIHRTATW
jgi:hypothetical protein